MRRQDSLLVHGVTLYFIFYFYILYSLLDHGGEWEGGEVVSSLEHHREQVGRVLRECGEGLSTRVVCWGKGRERMGGGEGRRGKARQ